MGFADKVKKGLNDATRVGSSDLDRRRDEENLGNLSREIDGIKMEMGNMIFVSYIRGEPVDERFIRYCEKINDIVGRMNTASHKTSDCTVPDDRMD